MNLPASEASLIDRILETPPEERAELLRQTYSENPGLRDRLRQIVQAVSSLESEARTAPLPSSDAERARVMELAFARQESAGATIGAYKLIQEIGEGGFGVVWLAEQREPIRRRVALKIIKGGMDTREVIARFEVERQSLALMDHPGIARVFDAGTTESGRPYFVMELVRGTPITRYCDENKLSVESRLRLFVSVCRAVQHAHQKGVIHRDLKPSNIIVTQHDGVAAAKIIDFGIAKATGSELTERTLFTRFHAFIGTPAYTSPEQMEMSGLDVDTRSDIYSLGVLLYELLAGRPPFDPAQLLKSSLEEMRRTIREVEPPTPSQSVRSLPDGQRQAVAAGRSTSPEALGGALRGDLDWIVMHCLEKDRTRRYETASGLAADVCRFLDNETVTARPASAAYRLQKFVRRNRLAVIAVVAVVLSLATGLIVASVALVREHAALNRESALRVEADASAAQARTEAAKSEQAARFMKDMLSGAGPSAALGRDTTILREVLDATAKRLDSELADQPEVATDLRETLALVNHDLGRFAEAEALMARVVASRRATAGEDSAALAASLHNHGTALSRLIRNADAEASLQEALAMRRRLFGDEHPLVADTMFELAQVQVPTRTLEDSERMLHQVLAMRQKAFGTEHRSIAETLEVLGSVARFLYGHEEAVEKQTLAVAMYRRVLGNDHPSLARALDSLGYSLRHISWKDEAKEPYRDAFLLRRKVLGAEHPDLVVSFLSYIGQFRVAEADGETINLARDFIAEQKQKLPSDSPLLAPPMLALASLLDPPGRDPAEAARLVQEARLLIDRSIATGPKLDNEVANAMTLYGWWKFLDGASAEGRTMCEEGLRLGLAAYGEKHGAVAQAHHILSFVYYDIPLFDRAVRQFNEAIRVMREHSSPRHPLLGVDIAGLGALYREAGRLEESRLVLQSALDSWGWGRDPSIPFPRSLPAVMCQLGLTLNREAKYAEAETVLREAVRAYDVGGSSAVADRFLPRPHLKVGLGTALAMQGKFDEAGPLFLEGYEALKAAEPSYRGKGPELVREALETIIACYEAHGMSDKAAEWRAKRP